MTDSKHSELTAQARAIIHSSNISNADKQLLEGRVPFVAESMLEMFVHVCNEDPFGIDMVVKSLKTKLDAQGNLKSLHEIAKQEIREIEDEIVIN